MTDSQGDVRNSQALPRSVQEEVRAREDEIDLADCVRVLWKWKYLIMIGSALPAFITGLLVFFSPTDYELTYSYDVRRGGGIETLLPDLLFEAEDSDDADLESETDESGVNRCEALVDRFCSAENFRKLTARLREDGFGEYVRNMSEKNIRLKISDSFMTMTIVARPQQDVRRIASIVRDNFERVVPTYSLKEQLTDAAARLRIAMADIQRSNFSLAHELQRKRAVWEKLRSAQTTSSNGSLGGIVLHFHNVRADSEYLPLVYQVQAAHASVINLEELVRSNEEEYSYYQSLLHLNATLSGEIRSKVDSYFDIQEFHTYLGRLAAEHEDENLVNYLKACVRAIEHKMSTNTPTVEEPNIGPIPKGMTKKATIVFVALLMATTGGVLLLETIRKCQARAA